MQDKREEPSIHIANENIIQLVPPPCRPIWKYLAMLKLHYTPWPNNFISKYTPNTCAQDVQACLFGATTGWNDQEFKIFVSTEKW